MSVTIKDNSAQVLALLEENKQRALTAMNCSGLYAPELFLEIFATPLFLAAFVKSGLFSKTVGGFWGAFGNF